MKEEEKNLSFFKEKLNILATAIKIAYQEETKKIKVEETIKEKKEIELIKNIFIFFL